jgi:PAS domain S-box-containing protein
MSDNKMTKSELTDELNLLREQVQFLLENESRYQLLVENIPHVTWITDLTGKTIYISPNVERIYGYKPEEIYTAGDDLWFGRIHPDDLERVKNTYQSEGESYQFDIEYRIQRKDGQWIWLHDQAISSFEKDGKQFFYGIFSDITERKQSEKRLRETESYLRTFIQTRDQSIWSIDQNYNFQFFNEYFAKAYLKTYNIELKEGISSLGLPSEELYEFWKPKYEAAMNGDSVSFEFSAKTDGIIETYTVNLNPIIDDGRIIGVSGIATNITDRIIAENLLRTEKQFIDTALNTHPDTFFLFEIASGKAIRWNKAFNEISGYNDHEIGRLKAPDSYYGKEDLERATLSTQKMMEVGAGTVELSLITKSGESVPTEYTTSLIKDSEGIPKYILSIGRNITKRKQAEEALQKERDFTNTLVQTSPAFFVAIDGNGMTRMMNEAMLSALGYSAKEVEGQDYLHTFVPESDREMLSEVFSQLAQQHEQTLALTENRVLTKGGQELLVEWHGRSVYDGDGNFDFFFGVGLDISDRKQADEEIKENQKNLAKAQRIAQLGHWKLNPQTKKVEGSVELCDIFGLTDEELTLESFAAVVHPDDLEYDMQHIQRGIEHGESWDIEHRLLLKDGTLKWVHAIGEAVVDDRGKVISLMGIVQDITERKKAEEALVQSEEKYRTLYKKTPVMLHSTDDQSNIVSVSDQWLSVLGYERDEVIGRKSESFLTEKSRKYKSEVVLPRFRRQGFINDIEYQYIKKNGDVIDVLLSGTSENDENGKLLRTHTVLIDVTEKNKLEAQVRQAQKMEAVGRLAGGVAHDFNNLLTAIIGNAELAQIGLLEDDPIMQDINEIIKTAERAASLTAQLLAFSRKQVVEIQSIDLNNAIKSMGEMLQRLLTDEIQLSIELASNIKLIEADQSQLEQVIVNLVVNAKDAMPSGGKLTLKTATVELEEGHLENRGKLDPGKFIKMSVSDNGTGMPPEIQAHIFEPFFTTKDSSSGTGLGLATSYAIVQQLGGFISVYSEEGLGTTFNVYLPISENTELTARSKSIKVMDHSGTETVMIVEDNESILTLTERTLIRYGYTVLTATNAKAAIEQYRLHPGIDIIVSDVIMPGQSGPQLIVHLEELGYDNPVIYMSGHNEEMIVDRGVLKPGINFISKPFHPQDLAQKVREVLDMESAQSG